MCVCVCVAGGGGVSSFEFFYLFILNFPTLNCLQFKPKLFSLFFFYGLVSLNS